MPNPYKNRRNNKKNRPNGGGNPNNFQKKKGKTGGKPHLQQRGPDFNFNDPLEFAGNFRGVLEIAENGAGYIRQLNYEFSKSDNDPFLTKEEVVYQNLRSGLVLEGELEQDMNGRLHVAKISAINEQHPDVWLETKRFEHQKPIMPVEQIVLGQDPADVELRIIDLIAPIGKGQRGLIVAPPRTGKTVFLHKIADAVAKYHPQIDLAVLLVDERPEEVTDFIRTTKGMIFASSNDRPTQSHVRISEMALAYCKRRAEMGKDVVLLIDSITRLGRAYNAVQTNSGRTMSGGLDIRALEIPKKIFGAARKVENGGSLTILATCLVETNSRMDDLIFEEFKGTGNMELVLDREVANNRIFPAINIAASGTRNEEKFITDSLEERNLVRRYLLKKAPSESMSSLLQVIRKTRGNQELLNQVAAYG